MKRKIKIIAIMTSIVSLIGWVGCGIKYKRTTEIKIEKYDEICNHNDLCRCGNRGSNK